MGRFARVGKFARFGARKIDAVIDQVVDHRTGRTDHDVHALVPVLPVTSAQRIVEEGLIVIFIVQHANAALREHRIAFVHFGLRDHQDAQIARQIERRVEAAGSAASYDHIICFVVCHCPFLL